MSNVTERIGELLGLLQSPDFYEREEAVKELGQYTQDEAVAGLVLAMEDPDPGIRELAGDHLGEMKSEVTAELLIRFLGHEDIGTRNLAAEVLVRLGKYAVPMLVNNITNDDYDVRKFIVDVLGLIRSEKSIDAVSQALWDENMNVTCSAAEALGEIGSAEAIPALIAASEKIEDVRLPAVEAIGKIGDPKTLDHLYSLLKFDDPMSLYVVLEAIGMIGERSSVEKLAEFLDHQDRTIGEAAMAAIIKISNKHDGKIDYDMPLDSFTEYLFEGIRNRDRDITSFTLDRLTHWYGSDVIKSLLDVLESVDEEDLIRIKQILAQAGPSVGKMVVEKLRDANTQVKLALLETLKELIDQELAPELLPLAEDSDSEVRMKVAQLFGLSGFSGAIPVLQKMSADGSGHVRAAAFGALGWLCNENQLELLFTGLDDKYPDVREAAMGGLIIVGGQQVVAKFNADLYHENVERQRLAVTALGWIAEPDVVEPLLKAINHPEASVRKSAINALTQIGEVTDYDPMVLALNDENSGVRKAAVSALVSLRGEDSINDVRFLLDDEDVWVRYHTINAIGEMGVHAHGNYILPYLDDEQDIIKIAASKALTRFGYKEAVPALSKLCDEKNPDVVQAASSALAGLGEGQ